MTAITIRRRIEWMDTDAAGIYHWTTAFRLAEAAEAELHTQLGIAGITFGRTPRVAVEAQFRRQLRFNDEVDVELTVERVGGASVTYRLTITGPEGVAVEGGLTACFVGSDGAEPWPEEIRRALEGAGERRAG
jgi:acyl-CoA thioesterase FadM